MGWLHTVAVVCRKHDHSRVAVIALKVSHTYLLGEIQSGSGVVTRRLDCMQNSVMEVSALVCGCGACATMDRDKMRLKRKENEVRGEWYVARCSQAYVCDNEESEIRGMDGWDCGHKRVKMSKAGRTVANDVSLAERAITGQLLGKEANGRPREHGMTHYDLEYLATICTIFTPSCLHCLTNTTHAHLGCVTEQSTFRIIHA